MSAELDYWTECVSCLLDEAGVTASAEQIESISRGVKVAHEEYGQAFYQPESPYPREIRELEAKLLTERAKRCCGECGGSGRLRYSSGPWAVDTQCDTCHGEGKVAQ